MDQIHEHLKQHGVPAALARHLGVTVAAVYQWLDGRRPWPADRCIEIEKFTHGAVRCEDLRPDVDWAYLRGTASPSPSSDDQLPS